MDTLFGDMMISYLLEDGCRPDIIHVSEVVSAINLNYNNSVSGTLDNNADIYFSYLLVLPSCAGMVDGLDMDQTYRTV